MPVTPLAPELRALVAHHLPNRDIKSLRLVCKDSWDKFHLRLDRVFLSANPLHIQVFRSIADHETFHHGIVEIIWDDARLRGEASSTELREIEDNLGDSEEISGEANRAYSAPRWYRTLCCQSISDLRRRSGGPRDRPAAQARLRQLDQRLSNIESWKYYEHLLQQQQQVLDSDADAEALRYGLVRFPALSRLIVTPTAHGFLFGSLYQTPMIRAFPYGFIYPVPIAWPAKGDFDMPTYVKPWDDEQRQIWRGVCVVLRELAMQDHHAVDFLIQPNGHKTGLNSRIFEQPCREYDYLVKLLSRPGVRHLELSLLADEEEEDWGALRNGRLRSALREAADLEHLDFRLQIDADQNIDRETLPSLHSMLPSDCWPKLQHFGLTRAIVRHEELSSVLQNLPPTARLVELNELRFLGEGPNPDLCQRSLVRRLREDLDWRARRPEDRPRIALYTDHHEGMTRQKCYDAEVYSFVYGNGPNPFDMGEVAIPVGYARDPLKPDYKETY
ncbi:hypothetical protein LQW54_001076 [Pestalotiopsis sp. IQ-011]